MAKLTWIKGKVRNRTSSIHTVQFGVIKTNLVKLWATLLPSLLMWEYDNSENKPENKETSFIRGAKEINPLSSKPSQSILNHPPQ